MPWPQIAIPLVTGLISRMFGGSNKGVVGNARRRADQEYERSQTGMNEAQGVFEDQMGRINGASSEAYGAGDRSVNERYGAEIQSAQDRSQANTASTQNAISQALIARGGDVSGAGASTLLRSTELGNENQANVLANYKNMNDRQNMFNKSRGDNLLSRAGSMADSGANRALSRRFNADRLLSDADLMEIQRRQATRQNVLDIGATALDSYGNYKND